MFPGDSLKLIDKFKSSTPPPRAATTPSASLSQGWNTTLPRNSEDLMIISQNVNTLTTVNKTQTDALFKEYDPDLVAIMEANPPINNPNYLRTAFSGKHLSSTVHPVVGEGTHGGTAIVTAQRLSHRVLEPPPKDPLGLFTTTEIATDSGPNLAIVCGYCPIDHGNDFLKFPGSFHATVRSRMEAAGLPEPYHPRAQFFSALSAELKRLNNNGSRIILAMDANSELHDDDLATFVSEANLVNPFADQSVSSTNRVSKGIKIIDFLLVSPNVVEGISSCSVMADLKFYSSDHRAMVLCIRADWLQIDDKDTLPRVRPLRTISPKDYDAGVNLASRVKTLIVDKETTRCVVEMKAFLKTGTNAMNPKPGSSDLDQIKHIQSVKPDLVIPQKLLKRMNRTMEKIIKANKQAQAELVKEHPNTVDLARTRIKLALASALTVELKTALYGISRPSIESFRARSSLLGINAEFNPIANAIDQALEEKLPVQWDQLLASNATNLTTAQILLEQGIEETEAERLRLRFGSRVFDDPDKLERLLKLERTKAGHTKIGDAIGKTKGKGKPLYFVDTIVEGKSVRIWSPRKGDSGPDRLAPAIVNRNNTHSRQADETTMGSAKGKLFFNPLVPEGIRRLQRLYDGNLDLNEIPECARDYFQEVSDHSLGALVRKLADNAGNLELDQIKEIKDDLLELQKPIPIETFRAYFKAMPAKRATGPVSGLTASFYKAIFHCNEDLQPPARLFTEDQVFLQELLLLTSNVCLISGSVLDYWRRGADRMIPKSANNNQLDRLRMIKLLEGHFNQQANWIYAKRVMPFVEKWNLLNDLQTAFRKNRSTEHAITNVKMIQSISASCRVDIVFTDVDMTAAFDRVLSNNTAAALKASGIPSHLIQGQASWSVGQHYYVITANGISAESYHANNGTGQGSSGAGAQWVLGMNGILYLIERFTHGAKLRDPLTFAPFTVPAAAYADDLRTYTMVTDMKVLNPTDYAAAASRLPRNAIAGAKLISQATEATGGKINLKKCATHISSRDQISRSCSEPLTFENSFVDSRGATQTIPTERSTPKHLGVHIDLAEYNGDTDLTRLLEIVNSSISKISNLPGELQRNAILQYVTPKVKYIAINAMLSPEQIERVQAPIARALKHSLGLPATAPSLLLHGDACHGGLEYDPWHISVPLHQLEFLTNLMATDSVNNDIALVMMRTEQIEIGTSELFMNSPDIDILGELIPNTMCKQLWKFMSASNIQIERSVSKGNDLGIVTNGNTDGFFMDTFVKYARKASLTPQVTSQINEMRLHLGIMFLSDIFLANSNKDLPVPRAGILEGRKDDSRNDKFQLRYIRATPPMIKTWKAHIEGILDLAPHRTMNANWKTSGKYEIARAQAETFWKFYVGDHEEVLYKAERNRTDGSFSWTKHPRTSGQRRSKNPRFELVGVNTLAPSDFAKTLSPAEVEVVENPRGNDPFTGFCLRYKIHFSPSQSKPTPLELESWSWKWTTRYRLQRHKNRTPKNTQEPGTRGSKVTKESIGNDNSILSASIQYQKPTPAASPPPATVLGLGIPPPEPPPPPVEGGPSKTTPPSRSEPCNSVFDNQYNPFMIPAPDNDELDFEDLQGKLDREKKYNETVKQLRKFQSYTKQVGTSFDEIQPVMSDAQWDRSQAITARLNKGIHKDLERLRMFIDIIDVNEFIKALCDKRSNIIICSDGSNNRTYAQASCGWVIAIRGERLWQDSNDPTREQHKIRIIAIGAGVVDGEQAQLESTRAELSGMLAPISIIHDVLTRCTSGKTLKSKLKAKLHFLCDNTAAVKSLEEALTRKLTQRDLRSNNADLKCEIRHYINRITEPKRVRYAWVKAHQDENEDLDGFLTTGEMLNVTADIMADVPLNNSPWGVRFREANPPGSSWNQNKTPKYPHGPNNKFVLRSRHCVQVKCKSREMMSSVLIPQLQKRFERVLGWNDSTQKLVDFQNTEDIMNAKDECGACDKVTKLLVVHNKLHTASEKERIYPGSGKFCKRCQTSPPHEESREHLLKCSNLASRMNADETLLDISRILSADLSIDEDIHDAIILRVNESISSGPVKTDGKVQTLLDEISARHKQPQLVDLAQVLSEQSTIGWDHFMVGFSARSWKELITARSIQGNKPDRSHLWPMIGKCLVNAYCRAWRDRNTDLKGADAAVRDETSKQASIAKLENIEGMMTTDVVSASSCPDLLSDDGTISRSSITKAISRDPNNPSLIPFHISLLQASPFLSGTSWPNIKNTKDTKTLVSISNTTSKQLLQNRLFVISEYKRLATGGDADFRASKLNLVREHENKRIRNSRQKISPKESQNLPSLIARNIKEKNDKIKSSEKETLKQQMKETKLLLQQIKTESEKAALTSAIAEAYLERRRVEALLDPDPYATAVPIRNRKKFKRPAPLLPYEERFPNVV